MSESRQQQAIYVRSSALAPEIRRLSPTQLRALAIDDLAVGLWDVIVAVARALVDDADERPWADRLDGVLVPLWEQHGEDEMERRLTRLGSFTQNDVPAWIRGLTRSEMRRFVLRSVGAAAYARLASALREDAAVLVVAIRRGSRALLPYAVSLEDVASVLSPDQLAACAPLNIAQGTLVNLAVQLDRGLESVVGMGLVLELASARPDEVAPLEVEDLNGFIGQLRAISSGRSRAVVGELSEALARKMTGARDAMAHSADPVSQAASSLIELIDRLLRLSFSDTEVLNWCAVNYGDDASLTFSTASGAVRPTKRAQALCFAYAGQSVPERSPLNELLATGIVSVRNRLQQLKHADTGDADEGAALVQYLAAVEGFLHFALDWAWAAAPDDQVARLRSRL